MGLSGAQQSSVEVSGAQRGSVGVKDCQWASVGFSGGQCAMYIHPILIVELERKFP